MTRRQRTATAPRRQAGAHAVEYAFIFPVFFALMYAAFAYGLVFTMRMGLQHAAEEGVREAIRYQVPVNPGETQISLRQIAAVTVARNAANWMRSFGGVDAVTATADICPAGTDCLTDPSTPQADDISCGETVSDTCQVVVTVEYNYQGNPIFPAIPGFGLVMPDRFEGRARALLDGRAMSTL